MSEAHASIFKFIVKGLDAAKALGAEATEPVTPPKAAEGVSKRGREQDSPAARASVLRYLDGVEQAKNLPVEGGEEVEARCVELIRTHNLRREHIPSVLLSSKLVWAALLGSMPIGALVRSLGKLGAIGLLIPDSRVATDIATRLVDAKSIRSARLHPMALLFAQRVYSSGHGERGGLTWTPAPEVVKALDTAFTLAFAAVKPAGKRFAVAIDVSSSMKTTTVGGAGGAGGVGAQLSCEEAAAAMALVLSRTEPNVETFAFAETYRPVPALSSGHAVAEGVPGKCLSLPEALAAVREAGSRGCGGTDCSLPMRHAALSGGVFDTFVVFTDNETWAGDGTTASEALCQYRAKAHGVADAKLVVVGMASNGFTVADPTDAGQL
eukprot:COSAG05_NODE_1759_length_4137_cov_4.700099_2_plen_380_part_01